MLKIWKKNYSLYVSLAIIIVFIVVTINSIHAVNTYLDTKNNIMKEMKKDLKYSVSSLQENIGSLIMSYAVNDYYNLILTEMRYGDNLAIIVEDYNIAKILGVKSHISGSIRDNGNIIEYDPKNSKHKSIINNCFYSEKREIISPLGEKVATVKVCITDDDMTKKLYKTLLGIITNSIIISIALIITLLIALHFIIFKPLSSIIKIISNTDHNGIPTKTIPNKGSKEIISLSNTINNMVSTIKDSSQALKKQKVELEELKEYLEELVDVKTLELDQAQKHMMESEKMVALGGLVAGVAHEINTPIGLGITGMSHLVNETKKIKISYKNDKMTKSDFEKYLDDAYELSEISYKNLKRAAELVKSFKQISIDQTNEQKREFNLKQYIDDTILSLYNKIKKSNVDIRVSCPDSLNIFSYPGAFSQIVTNFIMNSIIHAYEMSNTKGKISLDFKVLDSSLKFIYKDDGKGILKENLSRIFNPFFTTNRTKGGSGLGLNIIYNIVTQQLGGTIECNSTYGEGTEFIIIVPLKTEEGLKYV